jgi:trimethylamine--corrinoid protein Co-methyltransferase
MKTYAHVLSCSEKEQLHKQSIQILEEVGVKFPSERALSLLEKNGARIDWDRQIAYISEAMVKNALSKAPKEFVLGGREPEFSLKLPTAESVFNLDGGGIWIYDYDLGKRRRPITGDTANLVRVFDEVEIGNVMWPMGAPTEGTVPVGAERVFTLASCYKNYRKHVQDEISDPAEVGFMINILKAILGSVEEIKKRQIYSVCYCTISPLAHEEETLEANLDLCQYDVPVLALPMPGAGSTAPASLASTIAMTNAEILSIFVIFQCENPGLPMIYGGAATSTNRRTGTLIEGAAETTLMQGAMKEMADYYGLPTMMAGCITDAKEPGMQAVIEKTLSSSLLTMMGADIIQGIGSLDTSMVCSLEQILIDEEIAMMCKRLRDGINFSPEMDFFEDIKAVGPTGHFLKQKNTRAAFRSSEYYNPLLADRDTYEDWIKLGSPDMYKNANKRVKEILAAEQKSPLSANVTKEIDEIVQEAMRVL